MEEELCLLRKENGVPKEIVILSEGRLPERIGSADVVTADNVERKKIVKEVVRDVGEVFFEEDNEEVRRDFISAMESPEDMRYIHRAFVKKFSEDIFD